MGSVSTTLIVLGVVAIVISMAIPSRSIGSGEIRRDNSSIVIGLFLLGLAMLIAGIVLKTATSS